MIRHVPRCSPFFPLRLWSPSRSRRVRPRPDQVGSLAPVLLVLCRVLQGISAAGEQASANSMTLEHAPPGRRGFFTSFTLSGTQGGQLLATLVFIPVAALPEDQLLSLGERAEPGGVQQEKVTA